MAEAVQDTWRETILTAATGLAVVQRAGRITGASADTYLTGTLLPAFKTAYPVASYSHSQQSRYNAARNVLTYLLQAKQLASNLPAGAVGATSQGITSKVERGGRVVTTYSYDLQTSGSVTALINSLRPGGTTDEAVEVISKPDGRLRATFTVLAGADGNALLEWVDGLTETMTQPDSAEWTYTQAGSATGLSQFPKAPVFILDNALAPDQLVYKRLNKYECQTTWKYVKQFTTRQTVGATQVNALGRPVTPAFW